VTPVVARRVILVTGAWLAELVLGAGRTTSAALAGATAVVVSSPFAVRSAFDGSPLLAASADRVPGTESSAQPAVVAAIPAMPTRTPRRDVVGSVTRDPTSGMTRCGSLPVPRGCPRAPSRASPSSPCDDGSAQGPTRHIVSVSALVSNWRDQASSRLMVSERTEWSPRLHFTSEQIVVGTLSGGVELEEFGVLPKRSQCSPMVWKRRTTVKYSQAPFPIVVPRAWRIMLWSSRD